MGAEKESNQISLVRRKVWMEVVINRRRRFLLPREYSQWLIKNERPVGEGTYKLNTHCEMSPIPDKWFRYLWPIVFGAASKYSQFTKFANVVVIRNVEEGKKQEEPQGSILGN